MALADGLVGYWSPWLGTSGYRLLDRSGLANHGTLTNMDAGTDWVGATVRGRSGYALDFDGVNDCVSATNMPARGVSDPISFSGWFWAPSTASGTTQYFATMPFNSGQNGVDLRDPSAVRFLTSNGNTFADVVTTVDIRNKWTLLSGTWDTQTSRLYADGVLAGSVAWASTVTTALREMNVGAFRPGLFSTSVRCAEIYVHYRALAPAEIGELFRLGPGWYRPTQPRRYGYVAAPGFKAYWARQQSQIIGGGVR